MSEHEKDLAFLRQCILYHEADERGKLEERIARVQRDNRCVRRFVSLTVLLAVLGAAGLAYGVVLQDNFPYGQSQRIVRFICELELASLISLAAFAGILMVHRKELNRLRAQCRLLAANLLESRLGKPRATSSTEVVKEQKLVVSHQQAVN
jgi:hypothetical protein